MPRHGIACAIKQHCFIGELLLEKPINLFARVHVLFFVVTTRGSFGLVQTAAIYAKLLDDTLTAVDEVRSSATANHGQWLPPTTTSTPE